MSVSTEDFLKSIYQLKVDYGRKASSSNLATRLKISHAAVTDMAKKLSAKGLIVYIKYKEITLTPEGRQLALRVVRKHRLWETFLSKVLDFSPQEVHREAEILEHQGSEYLIDRIDAFLGHPEFDPHGDPIPDASGQLPPSQSVPLGDGVTGIEYTICRIQYNSPEVQEFFNRNGILLGNKIVIQHQFQDGSLGITVNDHQITLNEKLAKLIHISKKPTHHGI